MSVSELVHELEELSQAELVDAANYIAYLRFRTWQTKQIVTPAVADLAQLYAEFAIEDREEAEVGMQEYLHALQAEDMA